MRDLDIVKPSVPGRVTCLRCNNKFDSPDRRAIRICNGCERKNDKIRDYRGMRVVGGRDEPAN